MEKKTNPSAPQKDGKKVKKNASVQPDPLGKDGLYMKNGTPQPGNNFFETDDEDYSGLEDDDEEGLVDYEEDNNEG